MNPSGRTFLIAARAVFFLSCAWGLWLALSPHVGPPPPPGPYDRIEHFTGFYVLAVIALVAFPGSARWKIFAGLTAFGGLVEILQAIPALHRDCDVWDWATDMVGIGAVLLPTFLRRRPNLPA